MVWAALLGVRGVLTLAVVAVERGRTWVGTRRDRQQGEGDEQEEDRDEDGDHAVSRAILVRLWARTP